MQRYYQITQFDDRRAGRIDRYNVKHLVWLDQFQNGPSCFWVASSVDHTLIFFKIEYLMNFLNGKPWYLAYEVSEEELESIESFKGQLYFLKSVWTGFECDSEIVKNVIDNLSKH